MPRALLLLLAVALAFPASAASSGPLGRIVNGRPAQNGAYPAQGFLLLDLDPGPAQTLAACGGTVISSRKFLTAGHCAADDLGQPLPPENFNVFLGENNVNNFGDANRHFVRAVALHPEFTDNNGALSNDVAVLTFTAPVAQAPTRLIKRGQEDLWSVGTEARIIGWGDTTEGGSSSDVLLEADTPIRSDAACTSAYGSFYNAATMLCAGAADPANGSSDTCQGDSGGPLLVDDAGAFVLAGVTSWGLGCNRQGFPAVYARVGAPALNAWIRGRVSDLEFTSTPGSPEAGQPVTFTATAVQGRDDFSWDFDADGVVDASGPAVTHTFAGAGRFETVVRETDAEGQPAEQRRAIDVAAPPGPPPPPTPTPTPIPTPPASQPQGPLATILVFGRPKVRHRRFSIRVNFAQAAPPGTAVIEVLRGRRVIGIARTRVRRGGSKRVRVKLTPAGARRLTRSATGHLRVTLRVRVKRQVLRTKRVTIRR